MPQKLSTGTVLAGFVLAGIMAAGVGWMLYDARRITRRMAEQSVQNVVLGLEREIGRTIESLALSLRAVVAAAQHPELSGLDASLKQAVLFDGALAAEAFGGVIVTDEAGRVVHDSASFVPRPIDVADRDYFRTHRDRSDVGLVLSRPIRSRGGGRWSIGLARRVNRPDDSFAGVAVGALRLDYVRRLLDAPGLGERDNVSLFTTDERLVVRRPHDERLLDQDVSGAEVFRHLARAPTGTFQGTGVVDGVARLYAYRRIGSLPLVLIVGFSDHAIYASWTRTAVVVGVALLFMLLLAGGLALALRCEFRRRAHAEQAARQVGQMAHANAAQLQLITNNTDDLLLHLDWDGTRRYVSAACERLLGRAPAELLGRNWYEFVHPEDRPRLEAALAEMRQGKRPPPVVSRVRRSDGIWRHFEASGRGLRDDAGAILVVRDVTERVCMEERLRQGQRMEAVGRLTAGVAHDFNNLLQILLGDLELASDEEAEPVEMREYLLRALRTGRRGAQLTSHLLSFSRQQTLRPTPVDLASLLDELSRTLSRTLGRDVALRVQVQAGLPYAFVDAAHLDAALLNLALNARDAMPEGGDLRIEAYPERDRVVVTVSDTGEGMAPEVLARACEPFFTTKGLKGSGLGLFMVQGFAHQSDGEFHIRSALGQGTRVELWLPLASPVAASPRLTLGRSIGRGRVLVVDDEDDVGRVAAAFLSKAGFAVTVANGADEALATLGVSPMFQALVTDFAMPGMNGAELVLRARALHPELPALVITGHAGAETLERLPADVEILRKPFPREHFARKVKELVEGVRGVPPPGPEQTVQTINEA